MQNLPVWPNKKLFMEEEICPTKPMGSLWSHENLQFLVFELEAHRQVSWILQIKKTTKNMYSLYFLN